MASKSSKATDDRAGRVIDMAELGRRLSARGAEPGLTDDAELCKKLRNAGANRTVSKRALLKAIEEAGGTW